MKTKVMTVAILAAALATPAHADKHMIYGLGVETCQVSLAHDWVSFGEAAWVEGFMSASTIAVAHHDMLPGQPATDLLRIVFEQCQAQPFTTLGMATETIMWRLWNVQQPTQSKAFAEWCATVLMFL